jgi:hypothetical protein
MPYKIVHAKKDLQNLKLNKYVNIAKPDTYDGAVYKFDTNLTGGIAEKLIEKIDATLAQLAPEVGGKPSPKRPYKRNDDGTVTFAFKIKEFKEGERPFKVWDMKMNPLTDVPNVTGGTVINLNFAFYVSEYKGKAFIALQPTHVQIKEAVIYQGADSGPTFGSGDGFSDDDDSEGPNFDSGANDDVDDDDVDDVGF